MRWPFYVVYRIFFNMASNEKSHSCEKQNIKEVLCARFCFILLKIELKILKRDLVWNIKSPLFYIRIYS